MSKYLLSGTDAGGRNVTETISATSTEDAVRQFKARGFADVVLHSDEVVGLHFRAEAIEYLSPRDNLALGRVGRGGFLWQMIVRLYRQQWWLFALMFALVAGRRALEAPWELLDSLVVGFLVFPAILIVFAELFSPSRKYERVMSYNAWGRWTEMLAALHAVRHFLPDARYAFYEAKALAGLGRLDEALDGVRPYADDPKTPAWLYWGLLADVFHTARLGDRAIECAERAHEHAPENMTVLLDLAMSLLRYRRDVERARPLIKMAHEHEISDLVLPFLYMIEGVLALEDRQPELARQKLEESVKLAELFRHTTALMGPAIDRIHTYLSLAFAATGDLVAAEKHFRIAEPRLRAFRTDDLIERCQLALGQRA